MLSIQTTGNEKNSMSAVFFDWQIKVLEIIPDYPSAIESGEVHRRVNEIEGIKISRASVINFLNALYDEGLLRGIERSGKGGMRYAYQYEHDRHYFDQRVASLLFKAIQTEYPDFNLSDLANEDFN